MPGNRLNRSSAIELLGNAPQRELMERSSEVRQSLHPGNDVTFVADTNPNYTNVCVTDCTFCSFYRKPGADDTYTLAPADVGRKVAQAQSKGATTVLLQGGHNPSLPFHYYLDLITAINYAAPGIHPHLFSPSEIVQIAESASLSTEEVLKTFWSAGLRTMPGGGAEILMDSVRRRISPKKISSDIWLRVMREAHLVGFKTTATMTYGHVESGEDIVDHLLKLRALQDETDGFYAFIPWSFKPGASPLSRLVPQPALPSRYVRIIAVARLVLDNIPHIQASWFGEGWRAGQLALHAGADDFGGLLIEENVLNAANHRKASRLGAVLRTIRDAGFVPVQRTTPYDHIQRYNTPIDDEWNDCDFAERSQPELVEK